MAPYRPLKPTWARESCDLSMHEYHFATLLVTVFQSALLLNGSIVDSGAHFGGESCFFADLAPERTVHAVEPLNSNIHRMGKYRDRKNIKPLLGALGSTARMMELHTPRHSSMLSGVTSAPNATKDSRTAVPVYRLDDLFATERLAFAHLDVEGSENDVLRGAEMVLRRDRPVFTVEVTTSSTAYWETLRTLKALDYRAMLVDEQCGVMSDCRNIICVPQERSAELPKRVIEETNERTAKHVAKG